MVKSYVRDGALVDFPHQWQALCEACGFITVHEHHALLANDYGTRTDLFGTVTEHKVKVISFFRRLAENRGSPVIEWETVLCMRKLPIDDATDDGRLDACLTSPPYAGAGEVLGAHHGIDYTKARDSTGRQLTPGRGMYPYGTTPGQLGALPAGTPLCP